MINTKKWMLLTVMLAATLLMFSGSVMATTGAGKTLSIGSGSGLVGATVSLPITVGVANNGEDNADGVGGIAFTIGYDTGLFEFTGLEMGMKAISDGSDLSPYTADDIKNHIFYQWNDLKDPTGNKLGRVAVASASAYSFTGDSYSVLKAKFQIKAGNGTFDIDLLKTIIDNPNAGYNGEFVPVLVGMPASDPVNGFFPTPTYPATLKKGSITVQAQTATISGTIKYGDGNNANGSTVKLKRQAANGAFVDVENGTTTVQNGSYSFSNRAQNEDYRVDAFPLDEVNFFKAISNPVTLTGNVTVDLTLPGAVERSGNVTVNGQVLAGVSVVALGDDGSEIPAQVDSVTGEWRITGLDPNVNYTLSAVYGDEERPIVEGNSDVTIPLYSISGTIAGVGSGNVTIIAIGGGLNIGQTETAQASLDYTINNLVEAGNYIVSAEPDNDVLKYYDDVTDSTAATPVSVGVVAGNATGIDFSYAVSTKATIRGSVMESGSAVVGILVLATESQTFATVATETDASGDYTLTVSSGCYEVYAVDDAGGDFYYNLDDQGSVDTVESRFDADLVCVILGENRTEVDMDLTQGTCSLSGNVTFDSAGGDPVIGAFVTVEGNVTGNTGGAFTDGEGSYLIDELVDDTYLVEMNPQLDGYVNETETVTISANNCNPTQDFIVGKGSVLSGKVTDEDTGLGIVLAEIYLRNNTTGEEPVGGKRYYTGGGGQYEINGLEDDLYTLLVIADGYATKTDGPFTVSGDTERNVSMRKGSYFFGTVQDGSGNGIPGVTVQAVLADQPPVGALSESDGTYAIYDLQDTTYTVIAQKQGFERQVQVLKTPATIGTQVDFTLTPPAQTFDLSGQVSTAVACGLANTEVEGARVTVIYQTGDFYRTETDASGNYSFTGLPASASITLEVVPPSTISYLGVKRSTIDGTLGDIAGGVGDVEFTCGSDISGEVTTASNVTSVRAFLFNQSGQIARQLLATKTGATTWSYTFKAVLAGTYRVGVRAGSVQEYYDGAANLAAATTVNQGQSNVDIDFTD